SGCPCPMCLTSMYYAGIEDIYYCASVEETKNAGLGAADVIYHDLAQPNEERQIVMKEMPLEAGMDNPMTMWKTRHSQGLKKVRVLQNQACKVDVNMRI